MGGERMKCNNCSSLNMIEMIPIANQIWNIKLAKKISKNKYDKKTIKDVVAYCCEECGNVQFMLEKE